MFWLRGRSLWSHCLRRGSAATRLLGLWVRIRSEHGCLFLVSVVCCQVEVCARGRSLVQRSLTEYGLSECDREASIMRRPWPTSSVNDVWFIMFGGNFKILVNMYIRIRRRIFKNILVLGLKAANCHKETFC